MRPILRLPLLALLLAAAAAGCEGLTDSPDPIPPALVAAWEGREPNGATFTVQTPSGPRAVQASWEWTFRADGTYAHRSGLVSGAERSDGYVETGTFEVHGRTLRLTATAYDAANAASGWPVTLTPRPGKRRRSELSYFLAGDALHLSVRCDDTSSCAGIPPLARRP